MRDPVRLPSDREVDQERHVGTGGDLALVLALVLQRQVPDDQPPVRRARAVEGLQPEVGGVGVAAHRQQGGVR